MMRFMAASRLILCSFAIYTVSGCAPVKPVSNTPRAMPAYNEMEPQERLALIADDFIALTLEAGTYEAEWVDAYYGPPEIRNAAEAHPRSLKALREEASRMMMLLSVETATSGDYPEVLQRGDALFGMVFAAYNRIKMLEGEKFTFDNEAIGLFATLPQLIPFGFYDAILAKLETEIPGAGPLAERVDAFNERYVIPKERLKLVFDAAIAECRKRTVQHIKLPKGENFTMEFVTGKPWSGYNYYKGNYKSLIQINTDLPIRISRAVDLGCHEGYPGHHVLNLMIESKLARGRGWKEFEVNPLYSPQSVISEGSANYGIDLAFPAAARLNFERDVLYPLAGLDPKSAEAYWKLQQATDALSGARLTIAKMYLDGEVTREKAVELTQKYLLLSPKRAEQSVGFTDHYRSYVINYGWGKELVKGYIERGKPDTNERWKRMEKILSEPVLPADLQK
jgi:hypothetical protein